MILDAAGGERAAFAAPFDVCVVGAGPAGITLARRLAGQGARVALMEGGGLEISAKSQDLYAGEVVGEEYFPLDVTRLRYFGGSSNHWSGYCRELLPEDFLPRAGDPWSGWPIAKADLDPYQAEADAILDLPPAADFPLYEVPGEDFRGFEMRHSPPTRFAEKYQGEIAAADLIVLGLNANLVDLRLGPDGAVAAAVFCSHDPGSPAFEVAAPLYVLCLGGLENPRALLNANRQRPAGLGNEHDLVGRFFCEHLHYVIGEILLEAPLEAKIKLTPTPEFREREGVPNFVLQAQTEDFGPPLSLAKEAVRSIPCATDFTERLAREVLDRPLNCRGRGIGGWLDQRAARAAFLADPRTELLVRSEQALSPDSRVRLLEEVDGLGLRRIALDWRITEADYHTMRVAAAAFGAHAAARSIGRLRVADWLLAEAPQVPPWPEEETGGHHHLCTTRMSADPRRGVVDGDGRVHSVPNLYLGGSSTFATGSWINPTYTIVQLALRLGDHLAARRQG